MHAVALSQGNIHKNTSIGPSAVNPKGNNLVFTEVRENLTLPKEMTLQDIKEVKSGFVNAAKNAKEAGFDGIEVHGANGYILGQFLTDYTNQRTDEYGGSTEKRVRLLVKVIQAIRDIVGKDFPVGIRISQAKVNDGDHKWPRKEKDAEIIFSKLAEGGTSFILLLNRKRMNQHFLIQIQH